MRQYIQFLVLFLVLNCTTGIEIEEENGNSEKYKIEGKILRPDSSQVPDHEWFGNIKVFTNTGYIGFIKEDGSFVINNVPWGSHVVQVMNPSYHFEAARVDISSKGKFRARAVNHIQPSKVDLMVYPLHLKSLGLAKYFQQREQWRITDLLFNPMVLMTVLPLLLMMFIPRMNDPERRKEMEQLQMPKVDTPDLSELVTNFLGGGVSASASNTQQSRARLRPNKRKEK